jgi:hypothetical protein
MGNRAVITTEKRDIGVYLHWNGGRDSVDGFLCYCFMKRYRQPEKDCYGWAYLCTVIGNYMDGSGLSLGVDKLENLDCDNWDNGMYIIKDWHIVGREYFKGSEQDTYNLSRFVRDVNEAQPAKAQIPEEKIDILINEWRHYGDYMRAEAAGVPGAYEEVPQYKSV